eukprot:CAMPEP_0178373176 /NCGR_PEP_ID=MMETSP0689_2-20121128/1730_1 /TAXON_ID=160604 /ORGANISM="Amphidinium massartii, Strain CS-259" /LENGTH=167 /DNA_ID=CAMNT_0019993115 /DNA_START=31 /DNA_END=531 /DNA_ORIENTATION=-
MGNVCRSDGKDHIDHIVELGEPRILLDDGPASTPGPTAGLTGPTLGLATPRMPRAIVASQPALPQATSEAACLAWSLNTEEQASVAADKLTSLHKLLRECLRLFSAQVLVKDATTGVLHCVPLESNNMSAADTGLRLGQLLCRWGAQQGCVIRAGLHVGGLRTFTLE